MMAFQHSGAAASPPRTQARIDLSQFHQHEDQAARDRAPRGDFRRDPLQDALGRPEPLQPVIDRRAEADGVAQLGIGAPAISLPESPHLPVNIVHCRTNSRCTSSKPQIIDAVEINQKVFFLGDPANALTRSGERTIEWNRVPRCDRGRIWIRS